MEKSCRCEKPQTSFPGCNVEQFFFKVGENPGGWGAILPINGLMRMYRWMGSHFHDWIDYNGVAFSTEFLTELFGMGSQIVRILGVRKFWLVAFKNGQIRGKKSCYRKNCRAVDLIFTNRVTLRFEIRLKGFM